jgi:hypothetical protein
VGARNEEQVNDLTAAARIRLIESELSLIESVAELAGKAA